MKRIIGFIFVFALTACSGSSSEIDQQGGEKVQAETTAADIGICDSLESFDQFTSPLPADIMYIKQ